VIPGLGVLSDGVLVILALASAASSVPTAVSSTERPALRGTEPCVLGRNLCDADCDFTLKRGGYEVSVFETSSLDAVPRRPVALEGWNRSLDIGNEFPVPGSEDRVSSFWLEEYNFYFRASTTGPYLFELSAGSSESKPALGRRLTIDGQSVLTFFGHDTKRVQVEMSAGFHNLRVQFVTSADRHGTIADRRLSVAVPGSREPTVISPDQMWGITAIGCGMFSAPEYREAGPDD
jgi:hypothetical protein